MRPGAEACGVTVTGPLQARLVNPHAFLSRTDLRELGLPRRAVDAIFRACEEFVLPGYSRPLIRVADYLEVIEKSRCGRDRVLP
jgi:hypothetical protein